MLSKRTRILTRILLVLCLSIGIFVFVFKERILDVYDNTIQPTPFQDIIFEKDTAKNSTLPVKNLPFDSTVIQHSLHSSFSSGTPVRNAGADQATTILRDNKKDATNTLPPPRACKEIKSSDIPLMHTFNSRIRLITFLSKFKQGDYITGIEFSNLYRRDPSIGKLAKSSICGFIEKNISQLTRSSNSFIIHTVNPNGIHTKLKIPFVEDLRINIDNGAQIIIGGAFTSKAPAFTKSILLPIQLKLIDILHNGEQFPTNGYISGDYYFIDYSKTKMAYKLR